LESNKRSPRRRARPRKAIIGTGYQRKQRPRIFAHWRGGSEDGYRSAQGILTEANWPEVARRWRISDLQGGVHVAQHGTTRVSRLFDERDTA